LSKSWIRYDEAFQNNRWPQRIWQVNACRPTASGLCRQHCKDSQPRPERLALGSGRESHCALEAHIRECWRGVAVLLKSVFFDNSMLEMRFLAEYSKESGFVSVSDNLPSWFETHVLKGL
jgi:hypothetical protein